MNIYFSKFKILFYFLESRLICTNVSTGFGGRQIVCLSRRSKLPLALGRISVGDICMIKPVNSNLKNDENIGLLIVFL